MASPDCKGDWEMWSLFLTHMVLTDTQAFLKKKLRMGSGDTQLSQSQLGMQNTTMYRLVFFVNSHAIQNSAKIQTLKSYCLGVNLSCSTYQLCDLGYVTFPLLTLVFLICKMRTIIEFPTYCYTWHKG